MIASINGLIALRVSLPQHSDLYAVYMLVDYVITYYCSTPEAGVEAGILSLPPVVGGQDSDRDLQ